MGRAFVQGMVAGYGIAIPVGAIAVLIVDLALRRGFPAAAAAGAGAASADLLYAALAMLAGSAIAAALEPVREPMRVLSGVVLLGIAVWLGARALREPGPAEAAGPERRGLLRIFSGFLGLTLLNPVTIVYFTALILGLRGEGLKAGSAKVAFVAGAFLASLSWQWLLAGTGSVLRHRLPARARRVTSLLGSAIVALLALRILLG